MLFSLLSFHVTTLSTIAGCIGSPNVTTPYWSDIVHGVQPQTSTFLPGQLVSSNYFTERGMAFPVVLVVLLSIVCLVVLAFDLWPSSKQVQIEPELTMTHCNSDNVSCEYEVTFRVGCPSPNFEMTPEDFIDFELLGSGYKRIGIPVRFACSNIVDRTFGELHWVISRASPLPKIVAIRAHHNQMFSYIFLYEYSVRDTDNDETHVRRIRAYITNQPTVFRHVKSNGNNINLDPCPTLPPVEWALHNLALMVCSLLLTLGVFLYLMEYNNLYAVNAQQEGSLYRSMFDFLYSLPVIALLLIAIVVGQKYSIHRRIMQAHYWLDLASLVFWRRIGYAVLFMLVLQCILSSVVLIYGGRLFLLIKSLYWFASFLLVSVCALGTWSTMEKCVWVRMYFEGTHTALQTELALITRDKESNAAANAISKQAIVSQKALYTQAMVEKKTVYFSAISSISTQNNQLSSKLFNPYKIGQSVQSKAQIIAKNANLPSATTGPAARKYRMPIDQVSKHKLKQPIRNATPNKMNQFKLI